MKCFLTIVFFTVSFLINAQFDVRIETTNPTSEIRDATAAAIVDGGEAPYIFKWSKKNISLESQTASGFDEGVPYSLTVTDAKGQSAHITFEVATLSIAEKLNAFFVPLVDAMAKVLLWDPFAAIGIYDPVVYQKNGEPLLHPNGDVVTQDCWLVVVLLIAAAFWFTFYFGFINFRAFGHAINLML